MSAVVRIIFWSTIVLLTGHITVSLGCDGQYKQILFVGLQNPHFKILGKNSARAFPDSVLNNTYSMDLPSYEFEAWTDIWGLEYTDDGHEIEEFISSRKLREAGYTDFELSRLEHTGNGNIIDSKQLRRMKRSTYGRQPITLSVLAYGETFQLQLMHVQSVLHPSATISTRAGDAEEIIWTGTQPDCFLVGSVTSHGGTASISYCSELGGRFNDGLHEYHIETLPEQITEKFTQLNNSKNIMVARGLKTPSLENTSMTDVLKPTDRESQWTEDASGQERYRRETSLPSIEIETAVYTDQLMTLFLEASGATSMEAKIERMLVQWNGVQSEWSKHNQLGYHVKITIKRMVFFTQNPSWYNASTALGTTLSVFCKGTKNESAYDHMHMHTGQTGTDVSGMAYQGGACSSNIRCGVSAEKLVSNFYITAHELGHNLGMDHDAESGCFSPNDGTMGQKTTNWSTCSITQLHTFLQSAGAKCLFETNIIDTEVPVELRSIVLQGILPGMLHTEDEICELTTGKGWRHRSIPWWTSCNWRSCIDMNIGSPTYGQMVNYGSSVSGQYCGEGKVCHVNKCMIWAETGLDPSLFSVVHGGWGSWQGWTACSRTCGRGVQFRRRSCDNPKPRNSPACTGEEYQAVFCSFEPCINDSTDATILIAQRAGEVCTGLIASGAFSADKYNGNGSRYHYMDYTVCEVKCLPVANYTPSTIQRYGLMPDGTPCTTTSFQASYAETIGAPWSRGKVTACLQGYCKVFGCDGTLNNTDWDRCGVCGGDNSTCYIHEGVSLVNTTLGARVVLASLPNSTYKIFFYFKWGDMKQNYLELWSAGGIEKPIIASSIAGACSIFDNRINPLKFAGTRWTYLFVEQYLFAEGPITENVTIKLYQKSTFPNTGVSYGYSVPRQQPETTTATTTVPAPSSEPVTDPQTTSTAVQTRSSEPMTDRQTTSTSHSKRTATSPSTTDAYSPLSTIGLVDCKLMCQNGTCPNVTGMPNIQEICGKSDTALSKAESLYPPLLVLMFCIVTAMTEWIKLLN